MKKARRILLRYFSTTRHRAKSTAGTGRIGHGSATHQTANLRGKLHCASLPRPQGRAGAHQATATRLSAASVSTIASRVGSACTTPSPRPARTARIADGL